MAARATGGSKLEGRRGSPILSHPSSRSDNIWTKFANTNDVFSNTQTSKLRLSNRVPTRKRLPSSPANFPQRVERAPQGIRISPA